MERSVWICQRCSSANRVTRALDLGMLGPLVFEENNRCFYLKGEILSGLFFCGSVLCDNILMMVSVYYADTPISRKKNQQGVPVKTMRSCSKKETMLQRWKECGRRSCLRVRAINLLMFNQQRQRGRMHRKKSTKRV